MAELVVGIKHIRDGIEAQVVLGADMSVVGIIGTAPAADALLFPLDTAVWVNSNDQTLLTALGATGTIVDAIAGISSQVEGIDGAAKCLVVRIADNADPHAVITSIVGVEANGTGIWAFLDAPQELGITPRILIAPGYTSQVQSGLGTPVIVAPGSGGANGTFALAFTGGTGTGAVGTFTVTAGAITSVAISNPGVYTVAPTLSFAASAGLTGSNVTVALEEQTNKVCANMPTICGRLKAKFIPEGPTSSRAAAISWLENLPQSDTILHPLRQDAKVGVVTKPLSPYIAGLYVRRDAEFDGVPGHSIANQPVYGLTSITPTIQFSIVDGNSLGQDDIDKSFGIMIRGETGVDGALTDGGWTFWGTDTLSAASEWMFANVCRMRDYIEINQIKAIRYYLGRYNITHQTVQAVINTMEGQLSKLRANGDLLDYRIGFDEDANQPADLRLGFITVSFQAEEPPVLRKVTINSRRYEAALTGLARSIAIQLGTQDAA